MVQGRQEDLASTYVLFPHPRIRVSIIQTSRGDRGGLYFCKGKQQLQAGKVGTNLYTTGLGVIWRTESQGMHNFMLPHLVHTESELSSSQSQLRLFLAKFLSKVQASPSKVRAVLAKSEQKKKFLKFFLCNGIIYIYHSDQIFELSSNIMYGVIYHSNQIFELSLNILVAQSSGAGIFWLLSNLVMLYLIQVQTSCEPMPMSWNQGLLGAPPPDPWLHPNISVGCTTS